MGSKQTKEEIIIAQNGANGASTDVEKKVELFGIFFMLLFAICIILCVCACCKRFRRKVKGKVLGEIAEAVVEHGRQPATAAAPPTQNIQMQTY